MRKQLILAALAGLVGVGVCFASASARDYDYGYRDRWYKAYERYREQRDQRRARAEGRAFEHYRDRSRYDYDDYSYGHRYRGYAYAPRHRYYGYYDDSSYGEYDDYSSSSRYGYPRHTDHPQGPYEWKAEDYPAGWRTWWGRMDRDGRGGRE
ncbi:MAG: hypothetical protein HC869_22425 [Rhodospirillales bacterium]|nr:hypothetical protein [Rhodospirillales bacterium]